MLYFHRFSINVENSDLKVSSGEDIREDLRRRRMQTLYLYSSQIPRTQLQNGTLPFWTHFMLIIRVTMIAAIVGYNKTRRKFSSFLRRYPEPFNNSCQRKSKVQFTDKRDLLSAMKKGKLGRSGTTILRRFPKCLERRRSAANNILTAANISWQPIFS